MDCWQILDIEPTDNQRNIKRAYAKKLKVTHPEDDPEGFQVLQEAFEMAVYLAKHADFDESSELGSELQNIETAVPEQDDSNNPQSASVAVLEPVSDSKTDSLSKPDSLSITDSISITEVSSEPATGLPIDEPNNVDSQLESEEDTDEEDFDEEYIDEEEQLLQGFVTLFQEILDAPDKRKREASWQVIFEHEVLDVIHYKQQVSHSIFASLADFLLSHQPESEGAYIPKKVLKQLSETFDWQADELTLSQYYDIEDLERILVAIHGSYMAQNPDELKPKWQFYVKRFLTFLMWFIVINMIMRVFTYILEEKQDKEVQTVTIPANSDANVSEETFQLTADTKMQDLLDVLDTDEVVVVKMDKQAAENPLLADAAKSIDAEFNKAVSQCTGLHSAFNQLPLTNCKALADKNNHFAIKTLAHYYLSNKNYENTQNAIFWLKKLPHDNYQVTLLTHLLMIRNQHNANIAKESFKVLEKFYLEDNLIKFTLAYLYLNYPDYDERVFSPLDLISGSIGQEPEGTDIFDSIHALYLGAPGVYRKQEAAEHLLEYAHSDYPDTMSYAILYAATLFDSGLQKSGLQKNGLQKNGMWEYDFMISESLNIVNSPEHKNKDMYHDSLAAAYAANGDFDAAIKSQKQAIALLDKTARWYKDDYAVYTEALTHYERQRIYFQRRYNRVAKVFYGYVFYDIEIELLDSLIDPLKMKL